MILIKTHSSINITEDFLFFYLLIKESNKIGISLCTIFHIDWFIKYNELTICGKLK